MKKRSFWDKILFFFFLFIAFQLLSFLGYLYPQLGKVIFCLILGATFFLTYKNQNYGWLILLFEFFAGHGGHLFEWGISLRLAIFIIVFGFWLWRKIFKEKKPILSIKKNISSVKPMFLPLIAFFVFIIFAFFLGVINNEFSLARGDFINYIYWLLVFPLFEFFQTKKNRTNFLALAIGCLFGLSLLTLVVFILFSQGIVEVHGIFYWWWREVVIGKATAMGNNFFRIVSPAHLLILPILLLLVSLSCQKKYQKLVIPLIVALSFPFLVNFSRVYWLAFLVGLIILGLRKPVKKYLKVSFLVFILFVLEFGFIYFFASQGESFGLGFFSGRLKTTISPEEEISALTRLRILPNLLVAISENPMFGQGLGAEVSYLNPLENNWQSTYHIDWGFFELWLEMGFLGLISFFLVLGTIFYLLGKSLTKEKEKEKRAVFWGLITGVLSLMIASLTGPFIFHSLGIMYLVLVFVYGALSLNSNCDLSKS